MLIRLEAAAILGAGGSHCMLPVWAAAGVAVIALMRRCPLLSGQGRHRGDLAAPAVAAQLPPVLAGWLQRPGPSALRAIPSADLCCRAAFVAIKGGGNAVPVC